MISLQRTRESWQIVFFIAAGIYAVGGIVFCVLTSGTIQPWARMSSKELDVAKSTAEVDVVTDQSESVDCRPKSQSNGELPTVAQENLYMQMLSPYLGRPTGVGGP